MKIKVKVKCALEGQKDWRKFIPPPPNEIIFDDKKLQLGRWIMRYGELGYSFPIKESETELSVTIFFPEAMIEECQNMGLYHTVEIYSKKWEKLGTEKKPLDHIHLVLEEQSFSNLLTAISRVNKDVLCPLCGISLGLKVTDSGSVFLAPPIICSNCGFEVLPLIIGDDGNG